MGRRGGPRPELKMAPYRETRSRKASSVTVRGRPDTYTLVLFSFGGPGGGARMGGYPPTPLTSEGGVDS